MAVTLVPVASQGPSKGAEEPDCGRKGRSGDAGLGGWKKEAAMSRRIREAQGTDALLGPLGGLSPACTLILAQ